MTRDPFRPSRPVPAAIYDAFQAEATKRRGRTLEEWQQAERDAVWKAASQLAMQAGMRVPTMDDVVRAERYAYGSIDYGLKWALGVERAMEIPQ